MRLVRDPRPTSYETIAYRSLAKGTPVVLLPVRLETRWFEAPASRLELRVRVYPDQVHVAPRREGVDAVEREETVRYHRLAVEEGADAPAARSQRARLDATFGAPRARWLVQAFAPRIEDDELVFPDLPIVDADESTVAAEGLPDRLALVGLVNGERRFVTWGERVPEQLPVGPFGAPAEDLAWQTDFARAESLGLAFRVPLDRAVAESLTHLLVLGVREDQAADVQAERLGALLERHSCEGGAALLAAGTPTSHTELERAASAAAPGDASPPPSSDGDRLARALGVDPGVLRGVSGADRTTDGSAGAMNLATWPATWGYFLDQMLGEMIPEAAIEQGRRLFRDHVRARGPFPTLCVGRQPYGVLPISSLERWRRADGGDDRLAGILRALRGEWRTKAVDLPRLGRGADPLQDLAEVLAGSPIGSRWFARGMVPEEFARTGNGPFDLGAAADVIRALEESLEALALASLGLVGAPNVLDVIFSDEAALLGVPLVAPAGADRDAPLAQNYLSALAAPPSLQAVRDHAVAGASPRTILYLLLRHATLLETVAAGDRVQQVPRSERFEPRVRVDASATVWNRLAARAPTAAVTSLGDALVRGEFVTAEAVSLAEHRAALKRLADEPVRDLEQLAAESLDVASHRLDAWITALATERLFAMRGAAPSGAYVGAWSLVSAPPVPAAPATDAPPDSATPDPRSDGFLHAPSLHHARTAAVLRAGFLTRDRAGDPGASAVDLSSERVRDARWLLDGVRGGRGIHELLGHRVERWLTEARLGAQIAPLRASFPLAGTSSGAFLDGLALHHEWRSRPPSGPLGSVAARLLELVDAAADVLLAEAVHQHVGANAARARAALEVLSTGAQAPPELDVIETPVDADHVEWRVLLALESSPAAWPSGGGGARTLAHPELSAWVGTLLGAPESLAFDVRSSAPSESEGEATSVSLADLDLGPLDVVFLAGEQEESPALRSLVRIHVGDPLAAVEPRAPLARALDVARAVRQLLLGGRPLATRDAADAASPEPPETSPFAEERLDAARATLAVVREAPDASRGPLAALLGTPFEDADAARGALDDLLRRAEAAREAEGFGPALAALTGFPASGVAAARVRPPAPELARASERTAWLHDLSRVRAPLAALERIDRATRESTRTPLPMQVWAPSQGLRLVVVGTPGEAALRGLLLDAWTEAIPRPDTTTGIAFHYDAPGARAPNAILVAVPPVPSEGFGFASLVDAILETEELARLRLVEPSRVHGTYLPAIVLAENLEEDTVSTDLRAVSVDFVIREG